MLRALLTARRYDIGEEVAEGIIPFAENLDVIYPTAAILLQRDAVVKRKAQRGQAKLVALEKDKAQKEERSAKRQRLLDGMGERLEDAEEVHALSQSHGSTCALAH